MFNPTSVCVDGADGLDPTAAVQVFAVSAELVEHFYFPFGQMAVDGKDHEPVGEGEAAEVAGGSRHVEDWAMRWVEGGAEFFGGLQAVFSG